MTTRTKKAGPPDNHRGSHESLGRWPGCLLTETRGFAPPPRDGYAFFCLTRLPTRGDKGDIWSHGTVPKNETSSVPPSQSLSQITASRTAERGNRKRSSRQTGKASRCQEELYISVYISEILSWDGRTVLSTLGHCTVPCTCTGHTSIVRLSTLNILHCKVIQHLFFEEMRQENDWLPGCLGRGRVAKSLCRQPGYPMGTLGFAPPPYDGFAFLYIQACCRSKEIRGILLLVCGNPVHSRMFRARIGDWNSLRVPHLIEAFTVEMTKMFHHPRGQRQRSKCVKSR